MKQCRKNAFASFVSKFFVFFFFSIFIALFKSAFASEIEICRKPQTEISFVNGITAESDKARLSIKSVQDQFTEFLSDKSLNNNIKFGLKYNASRELLSDVFETRRLISIRAGLEADIEQRMRDGGVFKSDGADERSVLGLIAADIERAVDQPAILLPDNERTIFGNLRDNSVSILRSLEIEKREILFLGHSAGGVFANIYAQLLPKEFESQVNIFAIGTADTGVYGVGEVYTLETDRVVQGLRILQPSHLKPANPTIRHERSYKNGPDWLDHEFVREYFAPGTKAKEEIVTDILNWYSSPDRIKDSSLSFKSIGNNELGVFVYGYDRNDRSPLSIEVTNKSDFTSPQVQNYKPAYIVEDIARITTRPRYRQDEEASSRTKIDVNGFGLLCSDVRAFSKAVPSKLIFRLSTTGGQISEAPSEIRIRLPNHSKYEASPRRIWEKLPGPNFDEYILGLTGYSTSYFEFVEFEVSLSELDKTFGATLPHKVLLYPRLNDDIRDEPITVNLTEREACRYFECDILR